MWAFSRDLLRYLLPAVVPSWRFFDVIGPAPRVEYALVERDQRGDWRAYQPRPAQLNLGAVLARLGWNPVWNERLFVTRCAERLMEGERGAFEAEIITRIRREIKTHTENSIFKPDTLIFRVVATERIGQTLEDRIVFESSPHDLPLL